MIVVADASAAIKLVLREPGSDIVRAVWDESVQWAAPAVLLPEVSAAITAAHRAGRLRTSAARRVHRRWEQVSGDINLITVDADLAGRAAGIAADRGVRGMDAVYRAVASLLTRPVGFLSFDVRQRAGLHGEDGVVLLPPDADVRDTEMSSPRVPYRAVAPDSSTTKGVPTTELLDRDDRF